MLCRSGTLGKGTLFRYPPSWVPTQSLFAQRMNNGTLEHAKMDCLPVKAEIRGKREARHPEHARRFSRERERGRRNRPLVPPGGATIDVTMAIVAMTINAMTPTGDREAKDGTDATTSQNAETATAEATTERDATADQKRTRRVRSKR